MHGSALPSAASAVSGWLLVALCATSGTYCLLRARRAGGAARGAAVGEALMGLGMAAMAAPSGTGPWGPGILLGVFCAAAAHALWLLRGGLGVGRGHHAHHAVGSLAMAYMAYLGLSAGAGHAHGQRAGLPLVTGALLVYFAGYVLLGGTRLAAAGGTPPVPVGPAPDAPGELIRACRLTMGIGMLAMLLSM
ncbi:DUF5134 domain-containing protein [Streptomyces cirratus]|uniref:DUF5134 domain-containing protein n=1 Tax=Streptomyces cirratus TaxID=68187 RepID=A0ABQ3ERS6_9ACTN|nr:DUF5134 domain-containing protein [Streptomyces cirratus]GHB54097.1 DUF5134 domain-containing protein [Streptomyces cirratus]